MPIWTWCFFRSLLRTSGEKVFAVCGNLKPEACQRLRAILPECDSIGPQSPNAFERTLADADLLITSPGSTTILQAMSINLPTLLLPSQNRSQFFNAHVYSRPGADIMKWPASVLDAAELEQVRSLGLDGVLGYIYKAIIDAAASQKISDEVLMIIRKAVSDAPADGVLNGCVPELGTAGAEQVAELVKHVAFRHQGSRP